MDDVRQLIGEIDRLRAVDQFRLAVRDVLQTSEQLHADAADRIKLLETLIDILIQNEPDDMAADGVTVLDAWRKEALKVLRETLDD